MIIREAHQIHDYIVLLLHICSHDGRSNYDALSKHDKICNMWTESSASRLLIRFQVWVAANHDFHMLYTNMWKTCYYYLLLANYVTLANLSAYAVTALRHNGYL